MQVELITIGDELLLGFTIDTNAAHLARALAAIGVEVARRTTVGDATPHIRAAVRDALDRTGAVITTGGLGPTPDDRTREAVAAELGRPLRTDDAVLQALEQRWQSRTGRAMPAANQSQALVPEGARIIPNAHGSAPGIWIEDDEGRWVAMLPGVPRELRGMVADELLPLLARRVPPGRVLLSRTVRTTGIAESAIPDLLGDVAAGDGPLTLAYIPTPDGVDLRLTCPDMEAAEAERSIAAAAARLRERLGRFAYGEDETDLAAAVLHSARRHGWRIAVAESCTGGMLGARITAVPGSSDVFVGGIIAYDDSVKRSLLGVAESTLRAHGAVSEPVALEMAAGACARMGVEIGLAVTGIAGPAGGTAEKPVGTVCLAVRAGEHTSSRRVLLPGDREEIRRRSAQMALDMVRLLLPGS